MVYNGEKIAEGTEKELKKVLGKIFPHAASKEDILKYLDEMPKLRRKVQLENPKYLGTIGKKGAAVKFNLIDEFGKKIGELKRLHSNQGRKMIYSLQYKGKRKISSVIELLDDTNKYKLPISANELVLYGDINIPKIITDELKGLGEIILNDAFLFYKKNPKFGSVDGNFGLWIKNMDMYEDYGGKSVNLRKFWKTMGETNDIKKSAFSTFTGSWAKEKGFTEIIIDNPKRDITPENVLIKFIKSKK